MLMLAAVWRKTHCWVMSVHLHSLSLDIDLTFACLSICQRSRSIYKYRAVQGVHQVLKLPLGPWILRWRCLLLNAWLYLIFTVALKLITWCRKSRQDSLLASRSPCRQIYLHRRPKKFFVHILDHFSKLISATLFSGRHRPPILLRE